MSVSKTRYNNIWTVQNNLANAFCTIYDIQLFSISFYLSTFFSYVKPRLRKLGDASGTLVQY